MKIFAASLSRVNVLLCGRADIFHRLPVTALPSPPLPFTSRLHFLPPFCSSSTPPPCLFKRLTYKRYSARGGRDTASLNSGKGGGTVVGRRKLAAEPEDFRKWKSYASTCNFASAFPSDPKTWGGWTNNEPSRGSGLGSGVEGGREEGFGREFLRR